MVKRLLAILMGASMLVALFFGSADLEVSAGLFDSPVPEPPINDDFYSAIVIPALPFTDYRDTTYATWSESDPWDCYGSNGSVWYAFTPEYDMLLEANTFGSNYDTTLAVYTGDLGSLYLIPGACNDDYNSLQSQVTFQVSAGTTYYFLVGVCCGSGGDGGGSLVFNVQGAPPPPNDDFANAIGVSGIPFTDYTTIQGATLEPFESVPECAYDPTGSIWYAFTPSESRSVMVDLQYVWFGTYVGVYTGNSLDNLTEISYRCSWGNRLPFQAIAGTTYYIQVGGLYQETGNLTFLLVPTPSPAISFEYYPWDASIYATVEFYAQCWDPAGMEFETYEWSFGDGTTAEGSNPTHNYAADGDYTVELVATTEDGRTGSGWRTVRVETHDVAITELRTPTRARVGEEHQIIVGLNNRGLYDEEVYIYLYKSVPGEYGYWERIGSAIDFVPVHKANRTVDFEFNYTFTEEDAAAKKVSFRAVANLPQWTDATPGNNEAISLPTLVRPLR